MSANIEGETNLLGQYFETGRDSATFVKPIGATIFRSADVRKGAHTLIRDQRVQDRLNTVEATEHNLLTEREKEILALKIRGIDEDTIAQQLSLNSTSVVRTDLYSGYDKLNIPSPQDKYDTQIALTQAALRGVHTRQLHISEFVKEFDLTKGSLLHESELQALKHITGEDEEPDTGAEEISALQNVGDLLGTATYAQVALWYVSYERFQQLTEKQKALVGSLMSPHMTRNDIAKAFFLSENTIKSHTRSIYTKLGITRKKQLVDFFSSTSEVTAVPLKFDDQESDSSKNGDYYVIKADPLTKAELIVLDRLLSGLSNTETAAQLGVSINTIKTHLGGIYRKVGVAGRKGRDNQLRLMRVRKDAERGNGNSVPVRQVIYSIK